MKNESNVPNENAFPEEYLRIYKDLPYFKLLDRNFQNTQLPLIMDMIETRFRDLEHKVFKKRKAKPITRAQKVLLLHQLGMLKPLLELDTTQTNKARILSLLLEEDYDNLHGDLSNANRGLPNLATKDNYTMLVEFYKQFGLEELAELADKKLDEIEAENDGLSKKH